MMTRVDTRGAATLIRKPQEFERVKQVAGRIGKHTLLASLEIMQEMLRRVQATTKVRILVETAIVRLASLEQASTSASTSFDVSGRLAYL